MTPIPEPYFADDSCVIYNADCRELLPHFPVDEIDLVLTDPPYGIGNNTDYARFDEATHHKTYAPVAGDDEPFDPAPLLRFGRCVIWGGNHFADKLPPSPGWLFWDKRTIDDSRWSGSGEGELAWTNVAGRVHGFRHLWLGGLRDSESGYHVHPTQKPVELMRWVIERFSKPGDIILDPYMGSGPTLRAAKDLGRKAIGIEIDVGYCQVAATRLAQGVLFPADAHPALRVETVNVQGGLL